MKIWTETIRLKDFGISTGEVFCGANASLSDSLFFDIETTGFKADYCHIYLIGCAEFQGDVANITLFFAEKKQEEKAVLEAFTKLLATKKQCFTFNGNRFDIPFIETRATKHQVAIPFQEKSYFDLYLYIKQFSSLLQLPHYNQKSIEEYLGLYREDPYNGGELIAVYKHYETHPNEEELSLLKQHNLDDVRGMLHLLPMLTFGYLYQKDNYEISTLQDAENEIILQGKLQRPVPRPLVLRGNGYYLKYEQTTFSAILYPEYTTLRYYYPNPKDYVYLPKEGIVIPKLLADSVPKSEKVRATKDNCYTTKESRFLPLPASGILDHACPHVFQTDAKAKTRYMECSDIPKDYDWILQYLIYRIQETK